MEKQNPQMRGSCITFRFCAFASCLKPPSFCRAEQNHLSSLRTEPEREMVLFISLSGLLGWQKKKKKARQCRWCVTHQKHKGSRHSAAIHAQTHTCSQGTCKAGFFAQSEQLTITRDRNSQNVEFSVCRLCKKSRKCNFMRLTSWIYFVSAANQMLI